MLVMMKHPLHGRLPVYSVSEVESNKAAGWVIDADAPETKAEVVPPAPPPAAPEPAPRPRKSFFASADDSEV